ncbi:hypothetical protein JKF63_06760 [Porcisia hertigi]|uniref:CSD domain-containing protein n=1 Tax=Porcisia hertigi TaxID=2761500 RepID=A0A836LH48_9TRYP|nr:hypothetical protein JKF63_06760 [Porcisia hertigi]
MFMFSRRRLFKVCVTSPHLIFSHRTHVVTTAALSTSHKVSWGCALMSGLALRAFSNTPAQFGCSAGTLSYSKPCLGGFGAPGHDRRQGAGHSAVRLHGTITAFKHRRGYGFVLAEGVAAAAHPHRQTYVALESQTTTTADKGVLSEQEEEAGRDLPKSFFFTRAALHGGFYVTEGEQVSFSVSPLRHGEGVGRRVAGDSPSSGKEDGDPTAVAVADTEELSLGSEQAELREHSSAATKKTSSQNHVAIDLRYYDAKTGKETPISPLMLYGKIVEWDAAEGLGMIAELDTRKQYHENAPRFPFSLENADLSLGTELRIGRYVRFCLEPASPLQVDGSEDTAAAATPVTAAGAAAAAAAPDGSEDVELVAQRVIIDTTMERRKGAIGRPLVPANAAPGTMTSESRFSGVVREVKGAQFGFIQDDLSGESIFFHLSNASVKVKTGDRVTYLLREVAHGKHAGKKACYDVLIDEAATSRLPSALSDQRAATDDGDTGGGRRQAHAAKRRSKTAHDEEDLDFDLLD